MVDEMYFVENGCIYENLQRAPKFLLVLTALFGRQQTYKIFEGPVLTWLTQFLSVGRRTLET